MGALPAADVDHMFAHTDGLWDELRGGRVFLTGGTGFFGCWLLEAFAEANDRLDLHASAVVLTRNPSAFVAKAPHLAAHPAIRVHEGDIRSCVFPGGSFSHVILGAVDASAKLNEDNPSLMFDTIVEGTRRTLDFARRSRAQKVLLMSSGAVYGKQPAEITHVPEEFTGAPDPTVVHSAYGEGKRVAEFLCTLYARQFGIHTKLARCFAFVGAHLPLDTHFAIGNFILDALRGETIHVNGDGTPYRSYLYAADLAIWLWTILFLGQSCRPYNVGSSEAITVAELAALVSDTLAPGTPVVVARQPATGLSPERYVPSVRRAKEELGLIAHVSLPDAVRRTAAWYRERLAS